MAEGPLRTVGELRTAYAETLTGIAGVVEQLDDEGFQRETGCPGWTVHDCVAHVSALESMLIGRETPQHTVPEGLAHVRSPVGALTEQGVDYRRPWSRPQVLDEYRDIMQERLRALASLTDADLENDTEWLFGTSTLRRVLMIRVFDIWSHEQDIRRAVGNPGGFDGLAGQNARDRLLRGFAMKFEQRNAAPDGTSIRLHLGEPIAVDRHIVIRDGRARVVDAAGDQPDVTLRADMNTWTVLGCGRADVPGALSIVSIDGDQTLGRALLEDLAFTP